MSFGLEDSLLTTITANKKYLPQIKILGLGGAGSNIVNKIISQNFFSNNTDIIAINTDLQSLENNNAPRKIAIGKDAYYGAGGSANTGKQAALESQDELKESIRDTDLLFIIAGMGGGTGTGASSVIANMAKELNILTISTVTAPFLSEGRSQKADLGIKSILEESDSVIIIDNEKSVQNAQHSQKSNSHNLFFEAADNAIIETIKDIYSIIYNSEEMNIDFADMKATIQNSGVGFIGTGKGRGKNPILNAIKEASKSEILQKDSLEGANSIILNFSLPETVQVEAINPALEYLNRFTNGAEIKFGMHHTKDNFVKVVIIGTDFTELKSDENIDSMGRYSEDLEAWVPKTISSEFIDIPAIILKKKAKQEAKKTFKKLHK